MKILSFSTYSDGRSVCSAYNFTIGRFISAPNPGAFALLFPIAILLVVYIRP